MMHLATTRCWKGSRLYECGTTIPWDCNRFACILAVLFLDTNIRQSPVPVYSNIFCSALSLPPAHGNTRGDPLLGADNSCATDHQRDVWSPLATTCADTPHSIRHSMYPLSR
jgi:hypothetical protein